MASVKIHLDGLEALVKSVGGLQALARTPFIFKYSCWYVKLRSWEIDPVLFSLRINRSDMFSAIVLGTKPRFGLVNPALLPLHPDLSNLEPYTLLTARYRARISNLTGLPEMSQEMIEVFRIFRHLVVDKERTAGLQTLGITEADYQSLQSYCTQLIYRLIALIQFDARSPNSLVFRLFGNAAVAHIFMFTYNLPPRSDTHVLMSTRIRANLEMIDVQVFQNAYPEMMLWVIMIGGLGSIGTEDQAWYIRVLAQFCFATGIAGMDEIALSLTEFVWSEFYQGSIFDEFWKDYAIVRESLAASGEIG
jgi:hypothetical protein